jgi:hypothetical protein
MAGVVVATTLLLAAGAANYVLTETALFLTERLKIFVVQVEIKKARNVCNYPKFCGEN